MNDERIVLLLDALFAKAEYAVQNGHTRPEILTRKAVKLYHASHPLLNRGKAVASDIILGEDYAQMVITGPNTGGKTVALKTLGLSVMMAQCALFIPAESGSGVYVFDEIFAEIGDEQSIAQSLSTFSSHMVNIVRILKAADTNSWCCWMSLARGRTPRKGRRLRARSLKKSKRAGR
jgi:DNA mismatch repair protein MutS2